MAGDEPTSVLPPRLNFAAFDTECFGLQFCDALSLTHRSPPPPPPTAPPDAEEIDVATNRITNGGKRERRLTVRFTSETKSHDGMSYSSEVLQRVVEGYMGGQMASAKQVVALLSLSDRQLLPEIDLSVQHLISLLDRARPTQRVPVLLRGGGKGLALNRDHLPHLHQLHVHLLEAQLLLSKSNLEIDTLQ